MLEYQFSFFQIRKDREEQMLDQNFYLMNDNKNCVPVLGTVGLSNLWKNHLCKFYSVTLDTAEAIIKEYSTNSRLLRVSCLCQDLMLVIQIHEYMFVSDISIK